MSEKLKRGEMDEIKADEEYAEQLWHKARELGCIPDTLEPYPEDKTFTQYMLDEPARKYPNELAVVCLDREMTWKELKEHVDRFANALYGLGVKKGDIVGTYLQSSIQWLIADLAIPEAGAVHMPMSPLESANSLVDKVERTRCQTIVCSHTNVKDRDVIDKVKEARERTGLLNNIILTKIEDYTSNPPEHEREDGVIWFTDLIRKYSPSPPKVDIDPKKDLVYVYFTGGTTGRAKGVMLTHYNIVACSMGFRGIFPPSIIHLLQGILTIILPPPMPHRFASIILDAWLPTGATFIIQPDPRDTKEFFRLAKKYHPLMGAITPTQYMMLSEFEDVKGLGILSISASMILAPGVQDKFEKKASSSIIDAYGYTENSGEGGLVPILPDIIAPFVGGREAAGKLLHLLVRILEIPGVTPLLNTVLLMIGRQNIGMIGNRLISFLASTIALSIFDEKGGRMGPEGKFIGSMPVIDNKIKLVNEDTGERMLIKRVIKEKLRGELCDKGPQTMVGYWPNPGDGLDEEGYVHSGDVVMIDETGRGYIVDRTKDMANVSGYKVYTAEVDEILYKHPGVMEAATIGVPDPERPGSERVKVFITPTSEFKGKLTEKDIIDYLRGKVQPYAVPKFVEFRDEIPRTESEKIFKRKLREEEIEKMKKAGILK